MRVLLLCLLSLVGISASAEVYTGNCGENGDNVKWSLDTNTGVLVISGNGAMDNSRKPWYNYNKLDNHWLFYYC